MRAWRCYFLGGTQATFAFGREPVLGGTQKLSMVRLEGVFIPALRDSVDRGRYVRGDEVGSRVIGNGRHQAWELHKQQCVVNMANVTYAEPLDGLVIRYDGPSDWEVLI